MMKTMVSELDKALGRGCIFLIYQERNRLNTGLFIIVEDKDHNRILKQSGLATWGNLEQIEAAAEAANRILDENENAGNQSDSN